MTSLFDQRERDCMRLAGGGWEGDRWGRRHFTDAAWRNRTGENFGQMRIPLIDFLDKLRTSGQLVRPL